MDDVFAVIGITFPVFAMVALGYALVAFRVFSPEIVRAFGQSVREGALRFFYFFGIDVLQTELVVGFKNQVRYFSGFVGGIEIANVGQGFGRRGPIFFIELGFGFD